MGELPIFPRQFVTVDSALVHREGADVTVCAQPDPPAGGRTLPPPWIPFRGHLAGLHEGWLHLLRDGDTARIAKDYVRHVRLAEAPQCGWTGMLAPLGRAR